MPAAHAAVIYPALTVTINNNIEQKVSRMKIVKERPGMYNKVHYGYGILSKYSGGSIMSRF